MLNIVGMQCAQNTVNARLSSRACVLNLGIHSRVVIDTFNQHLISIVIDISINISINAWSTCNRNLSQHSAKSQVILQTCHWVSIDMYELVNALPTFNHLPIECQLRSWTSFNLLSTEYRSRFRLVCLSRCWSVVWGLIKGIDRHMYRWYKKAHLLLSVYKISQGCRLFIWGNVNEAYILTLKEVMCYHGKKITVMLLNTVVMDRGFIKGRALGKLTGCEQDLAINLPCCFCLLFLLSFMRKT